METQHDMPRAEAAEALTALFAQAGNLPKPTAEEHASREAALEEASLKMIAEKRREDARRRYEAAVPPEFVASDWDFPALRPFRTQIDRVLGYKLGPKGLLASGPTGRRKTGAMWALMKRLAYDEGNDVRFYSAFDFFAQLQEQVKYGHDDARGWIDTVARRPIVFIDDYGQQALMKTKEDWAMGWFFRFLDIRSGAHLPLFITTNMTGDEMASGNLRGDPLLRRFLMVCEAVPFETEKERRARLSK